MSDYEKLKKTFDEIGVAYETWDSQFFPTYSDITVQSGGQAVEFNFFNGKFSYLHTEAA